MSGCLFCKMIEKKIPATIVYEDDQTMAIEDLHPQAPVHVLVLPKKHVPTVMDLQSQDAGLWWRMLETAQRLAREKRIVQPGFRLNINCNAGAGQSVFHLHVHVLGGRPFQWPPG